MAVLTSGAGAVPAIAIVAVALVAMLAVARLVVAPAVMAAILTVVVVSDISSVLGKAGPLSAYLLALTLAVVTLAVGVRRGTCRLRWSPFFLLAAIWLATRTVSVFFASDISVGATELLDEAKGVVLLIVLTLLLLGVERPSRMMGAATVTVAALATVTLVQEFVLHDSTSLGGLSGIGVASEIAGLGARHSGTQGDPNFWGRILVLFLPFAVALMWGRRRSQPGAGVAGWTRDRWWLLAVAALVGGEYLSQSRGGLIAALVTVTVTAMLLVRNRMRLLAGVAVLLVVVVALPGVGTRLSSLTSLDKPSPTGVVDQSLLGREAALKAGLAMIRDSPLVGVGAANFQVAGQSYQRQLGLSALTSKTGELLAPHDLYLQMAAEGGAVGLVGWLVFYIGSLVLTWRTRQTFRRLGGGRDSRQSRLASAVFASLIGWGVASLFLHLANLPVLLVVVAFGAVLHLRARDADAIVQALPPSQRPSSPAVPATEIAAGRSATIRSALALVAVALLACSAALGYLASTTRTGWSSTEVVSVEPTAQDSKAPGYTYALLSRTRMMPTFVELANAPSFLNQAAATLGLGESAREGLDVSASRAPGARTFSVTVTASNEAITTPLVKATVANLRTYLNAQKSLYTLTQISASTPVQVGTALDTKRLAALVTGLLGLIAALIAAVKRPSARPRGEPAPEALEPVETVAGDVAPRPAALAGVGAGGQLAAWADRPDSDDD